MLFLLVCTPYITCQVKWGRRQERRTGGQPGDRGGPCREEEQRTRCAREGRQEPRDSLRGPTVLKSARAVGQGVFVLSTRIGEERNRPIEPPFSLLNQFDLPKARPGPSCRRRVRLVVRPSPTALVPCARRQPARAAMDTAQHKEAFVNFLDQVCRSALCCACVLRPCTRLTCARARAGGLHSSGQHDARLLQDAAHALARRPEDLRR